MKAKDFWANQKNKHWYHNPKTGDECMAYTCPKDYVKGRCKKNWIIDHNSKERHLEEQLGLDYKSKDEREENDFYSFEEDEDY